MTNLWVIVCADNESVTEVLETEVCSFMKTTVYDVDGVAVGVALLQISIAVGKELISNQVNR